MPARLDEYVAEAIRRIRAGGYSERAVVCVSPNTGFISPPRSSAASPSNQPYHVAVLAFVHAVQGHETTTGQLVIVAALIRETDVEQLRPGAGGVEDLRSGVLQYAVVVREPELGEAVSVAQCTGALYRRVRLLLEARLLPKDDHPSIFWRISGDASETIRAAIDAARPAGAKPPPDYPVLVGAESSAGARLALKASTAVAVNSPEDGEAVQGIGSLRGDGMPGSWIHFTLATDCRCPGCTVMMAAISGAEMGHGPIPAVELGVDSIPPKPNSPTIAVLGLPRTTLRSLHSAGVTHVSTLAAMGDKQLLGLRNIGKRDVMAIREAVARYSLKRWGQKPVS